MGSFKEFPCVRLEDQAFSGPEGLDVHHRVILFRNLIQIVVFVRFWSHIDVTLRPTQGSKIAFNVLLVGVSRNLEAYH